MNDDYNGWQVIDADGDEVGTVEESYEDDTGEIRFVKVKIGSLFAKHRMVPTDGAQTTDASLQVPYTKDTIESSPDASSAGEILDGNLLEDVRAYYSGGQRIARVTDESAAADEATSSAGSSQNQPNNSAQIGEVRDTGDVIEIPIVEEQLVKRRVVKEVLRVRKHYVGEQQTVRAQLRKEDFEIEQDDDVTVNVVGEGGDAAPGSRSK